MVFDGRPLKLSYEDLRTYTSSFSDENYIGEFQFGKVYHGKIPLQGSAQPKPVTIKIWEIPEWYTYYKNDNRSRLMDEVLFLQKISHPGLMKVYGYCCKPEQCGIVYDFKSLNTVYNLATSDDFKWCQRIKVALRFAQLLRFLHAKHPKERTLVIRNIAPSHIMVDEDWNPKLYDFGMVTGGRFPDRMLLQEYLFGCYGHMESSSTFSQKSDVLGFGAVLLSLIMKDVYTDEQRLNRKPCILDKAFSRYEGYPLVDDEIEDNHNDNDKYEFKGQEENFMFSLVHESFGADESFCASDGPNITRLAISCAQVYPEDRPTIKLVVHRLQKLKTVRSHLNLCIERKMKKGNIPFPCFDD